MNNQVSGNPEKNREKLSIWLIIIISLMITLYVTSNVMAVKIISIFGLSLFDAGTITFPFAYMLGDVLTEIWGFKTARKVIFLTFVCNIIFMFFTAIGSYLPYPEYMQTTADAYNVIFGYVPRIVIASLLGYLTGELANAWAMEKIKKATHGRHMWLRTIGSSAVGYFFDTVLFVLAAFYGTAPAGDLLSMIVIQYAVKIIIEAFGGTPLAYGLVAKIRKQCEV